MAKPKTYTLDITPPSQQGEGPIEVVAESVATAYRGRPSYKVTYKVQKWEAWNARYDIGEDRRSLFKTDERTMSVNPFEVKDPNTVLQLTNNGKVVGSLTVGELKAVDVTKFMRLGENEFGGVGPKSTLALERYAEHLLNNPDSQMTFGKFAQDVAAGKRQLLYPKPEAKPLACFEALSVDAVLKHCNIADEGATNASLPAKKAIGTTKSQP